MNLLLIYGLIKTEIASRYKVLPVYIKERRERGVKRNNKKSEIL